MDIVEFRVTNLHHFFNPDFLVIVFGPLRRCQRKLQVSVTEEDMVNEHD